MKIYYLILTLVFVSCGTAVSLESKKPVKPKPVWDTKGFEFRIAYNILVNEEVDNYDVFTMNPDGSNKINITNTPGFDWVYYAYEDRLYIISDMDTCHSCYFLYETDSKGSFFRKVTNIRLSDSWMGQRHEGQELIVKPHPTVDSSLYVIQTANGELVQKIKPPIRNFSDPIFSIDGSSIIFRGSKKNHYNDTIDLDELYEYDLSTKELIKLTNYPKSDKTAEPYSYHAGPPFLLNNGEISYISKQKGSYSVFIYNPLLKESQQLTSDEMNQGWHSWSPDNRYLIYNGFSKEKDAAYHIYVWDSETNSTVMITDSTYQLHQAPICVKIDIAVKPSPTNR
jgi:TolB protein